MTFSHKIVWLSFGLYVLLFPGSTLTIILHMVPEWGIGFGAVLMLLQGSAVLGWLLAVGGWRGATIGLLCLSIAWLIEYIGETSGLPFGRYAYTEVLQPQIGGLVPLPITFAWLMVVVGAWQLASMRGQAVAPHAQRRDGRALVWQLRELLSSVFRQRQDATAQQATMAAHAGGHGFDATALLHQPLSSSLHDSSGSRHYSSKHSIERSKLTTMLVTATLVLLLDLQIETVATLVNPYWIWIDHGPYYGVPTANFVAWWLVGLCMAFVMASFGGTWKIGKQHHIAPDSQPDNAPMIKHLMAWIFEYIPSLLYVLSTLMFIITNAAYGYWMAAAVGIGTLALLGIWRNRL